MSGDAQPGAASRDLIIEDIVARTGIDEAMIDRPVRTWVPAAPETP